MSQMVDQKLDQLIMGCTRQNAKCQKMLYRMFYGFSMGICLRYARDRDEAAQIMNRGFFRIFIDIDSYNRAGSFKAWVERAMINASVDFYRSSLKIAHLREAVIAWPAGDEELPEKSLNYQTLLTMVQRLSSDDRMAFNLFVIEGYSHQEIGSMLNICPDISELNLHKARQKLRQMILEENLPATTNCDNNSFLK
jgi:RNA polymerase sigma factor (sigma-70 family)